MSKHNKCPKKPMIIPSWVQIFTKEYNDAMERRANEIMRSVTHEKMMEMNPFYRLMCERQFSK